MSVMCRHVAGTGLVFFRQAGSPTASANARQGTQADEPASISGVEMRK